MKPQFTTVRKFTDSLALNGLPVFAYIDRDDFAIVKIEDLGMQLPHQTPVFRPDHFSIILITSGAATYFVGNKVFNLSSNQILFTRPDVFLSYKWLNVATAYNISFSKNFLLQYCPAAIDEIQKLDSATGYACSISQETMKNFNCICHAMYNEVVSSAPYKYELISNLIHNLLLLIRQQQCANQPGVKEKHNCYVTAFLRDVEDNLSKIASGETTTLFRIKDYANRQNLNNNYLSKIVIITTGKTINQWIQEKLICEIKYLLKHTDKPMREIATLYGFNDLNYFYNYFKKHTQNAPGAYRKNAKEVINIDTSLHYVN